ncbi:hypothetical protein QIS74_06486 [Colletotrichum tabaci]|uniref:Enoyl reductase (ER) domain-containing protein n=1 Tax=Colletotrichum tabaci TaxID=1209068 RepID=A0AAV9TDH9_9PEZI
MSGLKKNTAIYANEDGKVVIQDLPLPQARDDEILIEVLYSGVNPSDTRVLKFFDCRRRVLGGEFCGKVLDCPGLAGTEFKPDEIVAGYVDGSENRPTRYGSHQQYISIPPAWLLKVPNNLPPAHAAALITVAQTANDALFNRFRITPPYEVNAPTEGTLVIWGAASSVGMAAIQLARASRIGFIIVTASPKRHHYLKTLGATHCFDYNDENTIESIKALLLDRGDGPIWGFDAIGTISEPDSQTLLLRSIPNPEKDNVSLATVLLAGHDGFEGCLAGRHLDLSLDMPDGQKLVIPARPDEADRMWKALAWTFTHFGDKYQVPSLQVFKGTAAKALDEVVKVGQFA